MACSYRNMQKNSKAQKNSGLSRNNETNQVQLENCCRGLGQADGRICVLVYNVDKTFAYTKTSCSSDPKIHRCSSTAQSAKQSLDQHLWRSRITKKTKLQLYRVFILPIVLYGCECWAINKADGYTVDWCSGPWVGCGGGVVICLERGADLHTAQLMPLPLTVSCFSKIQIGFTFLVPAHPVCVCVCDAVDQWCLQRIQDIRWHNFVRNADIHCISNQPLLSSIMKSRRLTFFGILHEWMRMQMLAKPPLNLLQRIGGDHRGGCAQPGWRTFLMTCLCWILRYMRLEIWCNESASPETDVFAQC